MWSFALLVASQLTVGGNAVPPLPDVQSAEAMVLGGTAITALEFGERRRLPCGVILNITEYAPGVIPPPPGIPVTNVQVDAGGRLVAWDFASSTFCALIFGPKGSVGCVRHLCTVECEVWVFVDENGNVTYACHCPAEP
jgi:hypothetical protein